MENTLNVTAKLVLKVHLVELFAVSQLRKRFQVTVFARGIFYFLLHLGAGLLTTHRAGDLRKAIQLADGAMLREAGEGLLGGYRVLKQLDFKLVDLLAALEEGLHL